MGSVRDPSAAAMEAEELRRARLSAAQTANQTKARKARERALTGDPEARRELAKDWAPLTRTGRPAVAQPRPR